MTFNLHVIGIIHTPYKDLKNMPIQPDGARNTEGEIIVFPEYVEGLDDLVGFSHIELLYCFHKAPKDFQLKVKPFMDKEKRGIFATRSPARPNPLGLSTVELIGREGNKLKIRCIDVLDGTPLFDIKPVFPKLAFKNAVKTYGWLGTEEEYQKKVEKTRSDGRFIATGKQFLFGNATGGTQESNMKTKPYGLSSVIRFHIPKCSRHHRLTLGIKKEEIDQLGVTNWPIVKEALQDYRKNRENGTEVDNPSIDFPNDGTYKWDTPNEESSKLRYIEGHKDAAWMTEKNKNFLARIKHEAEGKAETKEKGSRIQVQIPSKL